MAWSKPKFYYEHNLASLIASSTATGEFDVDYLLDRLEGTYWQSAVTAVPILISFDAGASNTITADYLAVSGHNFNTIGATVTLQSSTNNFDSTGSDLLTNGDFGSATTGWTAAASTLASVAGGETGNCLEVTNSGAAAGSAYQDVTGLTVGNYYKFTSYFKKGTGVSGAIKVGTTTDDDAYQLWDGLTDATWTAYTISFKATETTARITFANESAVSTETALFDTASFYLVDATNVVSHTPVNDFTFVKEFASVARRSWRLEITGTLTAAPYMAICYWGEVFELELCTVGFDPQAETDNANVIVSHTGVLQEIDELYLERSFTIGITDIETDGTLDLAITAWKAAVKLLNFIAAWEPAGHPTDVWLMRRKKGKFERLFQKGGLYRNLSIPLIGRKEE